MRVLVDTNVLLRRTQPDHEHHNVAVKSIAHLLAHGDLLYFTLQNMSEFWNVTTRPIANNGLGFSVAAAMAEIEKIGQFLEFLPDSEAVYTEWKRLVLAHSVVGSKVHDAKLVAAMNAHGVRRILTFNAGDFGRYDVEAIHPAVLLS
ncbi:MAG: type II toxin-antitoxin system VapC family toxin [Bryobacteraceae bacterium]